MKQLINWIKKIMYNGGFFLLILLLTYYFVFSKINFKEFLLNLKNFNVLFLIIAFLASVTMLCIETLTIKRNLTVLGENKKFLTCVKYTFAGNFFSAITPAATGGQPMQIYLMSKDNIKTSNATLALIIDLLSYQLSILTISIVGFLLFYQKVLVAMGNFKIFFILGVLFNIVLLIITFLAIFSKKLIYSIIYLIDKILKFLKYKKSDKFLKSAKKWVEKYQNGAIILKTNKKVVFVNGILMFVRMFLSFTFPIYVYLGLGLPETNLLFIIALQAVLYISYAAFPLPGGIGIGETGFLICFSYIFPSSILNTAMFLSRTFSTYFVMFISGISLIFLYIKNKIVH